MREAAEQASPQCLGFKTGPILGVCVETEGTAPSAFPHPEIDEERMKKRIWDLLNHIEGGRRLFQL